MWWLFSVLALGRPTVEEAEFKRISDEMDKLAARNTWSGVERDYLSLVTFAANNGLLLTHAHHVLGAAAAAARGDVQEQWRRLNTAQKVERDLDTQSQIAMIEAMHGKVTLIVSPFVRETPTLEVLDPPGPAEMRTIEAVRAQILDRRRFEGLLPLGRYRLGALSFEIDGGAAQIHTVTAAAPVAERNTPGHVLLSAHTLPEDKDTFIAKMNDVLPLLRSIEGVQSIDLLSPAPDVTHLDFDASQLDALGSTPTMLARGVQDGLGLPDGSVIARPTSLVLRKEVDPVLVTSLHVPIPGGSIGLLALASMRRGPDGFSPPPGVDLLVAPEVDRARVTEEATTLLERERPEYFSTQ